MLCNCRSWSFLFILAICPHFMREASYDSMFRLNDSTCNASRIGSPFHGYYGISMATNGPSISDLKQPTLFSTKDGFLRLVWFARRQALQLSILYSWHPSTDALSRSPKKYEATRY